MMRMDQQTIGSAISPKSESSFDPNLVAGDRGTGNWKTEDTSVSKETH